MTLPNILFITIDTLRADKLSCYGYKVPTTPNIDRLTARSLRFEQAMTGGSWTQAAFPVMMTSSYASWYGGCLGPLSTQRPAPIEALQKHGYQTFAFSSSPLLSRNYGYDRGFRYFDDLIPGEADPTIRKMRGGERLLRLPLVHQVGKLLGQQTRPARLYVSAEELTQRASHWLEKNRGPFFGWIHYMDVHWPYHLEEELVNPEQIAQAWNDIAHLYRVNWKKETITPAQKERYLHLYEQALQYTDAQIGRLLNKLTELGLSDNTIIILVSDHGEEFLERGRWGHFETNLYDEILHVPLIISLPGMAEGQVIRRQVRTLDLMPTVLELAGCPAPQGMEGTSLVPLWKQGADVYPVPVSISEMWRTHWHILAVRTEKFKYIWNSKTPDQPKLFDLSTDPGEAKNVVERFPQETQMFQQMVDEHRERARQTVEANPVAAPEMDEQLVKRLRDLGYLE
ncbi:MAG: sulfatase [Anaerolineales bacterium]|nr:sulfatase [Anaerolineales bacterium]